MSWRRCIGIEPIYDSISAARAGLKSGGTTSVPSISVNIISNLGVRYFYIQFCVHFLDILTIQPSGNPSEFSHSL